MELRSTEQVCVQQGGFWGEALDVLNAVHQTQEFGLSSLWFPSLCLKFTQILIVFTEELTCATVACTGYCSHPRDFLADSLQCEIH